MFQSNICINLIIKCPLTDIINSKLKKKTYMVNGLITPGLAGFRIINLEATNIQIKLIMVYGLLLIDIDH